MESSNTWTTAQSLTLLFTQVLSTQA